MIKFGQTYNLYANNAYINQNQKTRKTEEDAVDTPKETPTKTNFNTSKGDEYRQWTDPKDGGETFAEAIVREADTSTLGKAVAYFAAYESLYGVQPSTEENTDDYNYDPRTAYTEAGLREYGITDSNIIEQYFDDRGVQKGKFGDFQTYSLKNDIIIDGKVVATIEELVEALGIKND